MDPVPGFRNWVDLAQDRDYWRVLVNVALNLRVAYATELVNLVHSLTVPTLILHEMSIVFRNAVGNLQFLLLICGHHKAQHGLITNIIKTYFIGLVVSMSDY